MPDPSKRTIMVVDDDPAIRESIAVFLHAHGYKTSSATDGYDALWQLTNGLVDVIVSDLEMPGLSGFEFLSVVRKRYPQMLVVAMTESGSQSELGGASADAFYTKGQQHPKKLLSTIAGLLRDSALQGSTQKEESSVSVARHRSDTAGTPHVVVTCPECLKSFSIAAPNGTDWREAREALAASFATVPAREASGTENPKECGLNNLCDSIRKLGSLVLRGYRWLWYGPDEESTEQLKGGTQTSPALHGKEREQ